MSASIETNLEKILTEWHFPKDITDKYKLKGIENIFEWQAECLQLKKVLDGNNLVYSAPTSAGKTLVAELLMLRNILHTRRKAIFIIPFKAIGREKIKHFQDILSESSLKAGGFVGSVSPPGGFNSVDVCICTNERANSLLNKIIENDQLNEIGCIVIDELHMVNDGSRGDLLELILSKIKYLTHKSIVKSKIQLIGMSATLPNLTDLSEWLDATLYQTNFRPIELVESIKFNDKILDKDLNELRKIEIDRRIEDDKELVAHLALEVISQKLGVLIFCGSKARCENVAKNIAEVIKNLAFKHNELPNYLDKNHLISCLNELKTTPAGLDKQLERTVKFGIGFHHAGLTDEERDIIEKRFMKGHLLVICCTSTLSSGINFPCRRVIIRTPIPFKEPLDLLTYKQMAGRAGRKGIDTCGECIIICDTEREKNVARKLILGQQANELAKGNADPNDELKSSYKRAILETICSGVATTKKDIVDYLTCFLSTRDLKSNECDKYLNWLHKSQLIDVVTNDATTSQLSYKPSQLGLAVISSSMGPDQGLVIYNELKKASQCFILSTEIHLIYEVTPLNLLDTWGRDSMDWDYYLEIYDNFPADVLRVASSVGVQRSYLSKMARQKTINDDEKNKIHLRFYTALILNDLVNEVPFAVILDKYKCSKSFVQSVQNSASMFAAMVTTFCNRLGWKSLELLINQFQDRLIFGVQRELVDLVRISLLNSHRARIFYNAGFTTVASIATSDLKNIERILRANITYKKRNENEPQNGQSEDNQFLNSEPVIWNDGIGYTYWEASSHIYKEANDILIEELEMKGLKGLKEMNKKDLNNKTLNKTMFGFNDTTIDSIIQTQNNRKSLDNFPNEIVKIEQIVEQEEKIEITTAIKEEEAQLEIISNVKQEEIEKQPVKDQIPSIKTEIQAASFDTSFIDDQMLLLALKNENSEPKVCPKDDDKEKKTMTTTVSSSHNDNQAIIQATSEQISEIKSETKEDIISNSFLDDQDMLEIAKVYENKNPKTPIAISKANASNDINNTILSNSIMELCDNLVKQSLSSKRKKITTPTPRAKEENSPIAKRKLDYFFGDQTLKDILNSSMSQRQPVQCENNLIRNQISNEIEKLGCSINSKVNIIQTKSEYETFIDKLKPKTTISIGIACEMFNLNDSNQNEYSKNNFLFVDVREHQQLIFYGMFITLDNEKQDATYFLLFEKSKNFENYLSKIFEREDIIKIMFYSQQHIKLLNKVFNISVSMPCYDPIIANWLLYQEKYNIIKMKQTLCPKLTIAFDDQMKKASDTCFGCCLNSRKYYGSMMSMSIYQRAFAEALIAVFCFEKVKLQLQLANLWVYYAKVESDVMKICACCELNGICLDADKLDHFKIKLVEKKKEIVEKLNNYAGKELNLNSAEEISYLLYTKLNLKPTTDAKFISRDKIKHFSTSKDAMLNMAGQHEAPKLIMLYRKISHCLSHCISPVERAKYLEKKINTFKIYSKIDVFHVTGRVNFYDPCMQNIPRDFSIAIGNLDDDLEGGGNNDGEDNADLCALFFNKLNEDQESNVSMISSQDCISIRSVFTASNNKILLSADYCQLEFRMIANLCKDPGLVEIFKDTKNDAFILLASKWLGLPVSQIDEEKRQNVKKVIYGIIYGISSKTLSNVLNLSEMEASDFIESFKSKFPALRDYIRNQIEMCRSKKYIETIKKRRRFFANISSTDAKKRARDERKAINTIVQGSASDLVKCAMVKIDKAIRKKLTFNKTPAANLILQMHDELIYEVDVNYLNEMKEILKECMENCMDFPVKMQIKMKSGTNWGTLN